MSFSIQLHATPSELVAMAEKWSAENDLIVTAIRSQPYAARLIDPRDLSGKTCSNEIEWVALTKQAPNLDATSSNSFLDKNPNALVLAVGQLTSTELTESWLTSMATGSDSKLWAKLARELKKATSAGALAVSVTTGESARLRNHRYSPQALELDRKGIIMRPVAGTSVLHFGNELQG